MNEFRVQAANASVLQSLIRQTFSECQLRWKLNQKELKDIIYSLLGNSAKRVFITFGLGAWVWTKDCKKGYIQPN